MLVDGVLSGAGVVIYSSRIDGELAAPFNVYTGESTRTFKLGSGETQREHEYRTLQWEADSTNANNWGELPERNLTVLDVVELWKVLDVHQGMKTHW